jgi:hypothetical protein
VSRSIKLILTLIIICVVIIIGCSAEIQKLSIENILPLDINFKLNHLEQDITVSLIVTSLTDSIHIERIEVLLPSFTKIISTNQKENILLRKDGVDTLAVSFNVKKMESFKIKGLVFGNYNNGCNKIDEVRFMYFLKDEKGFVVETDAHKLLGKKKSDGTVINMDDLNIFNQVESKTIN